MLKTQKADLRNEIRRKLKSLGKEEKSYLDRQIADRLLRLPELVSEDHVFVYASLSWEAGTDALLKAFWEEKRAVYLPKVIGDTMEFFLTESAEDLEEGTFHIMEPKDTCRSEKEIRETLGEAECRALSAAPVLVPGMGFTKEGARLGKGGGYYDRFLEKNSSHTVIALAYEFQIVEKLPEESYDQRAAIIVTEKRVIRCRNIRSQNREEQPC